MRAAELIGCDVYDSAGAHVGHVHDLRLEATGTPGSPEWHCYLTGLTCGKNAIGHRLGYGTGDMAGPWPLKTLFGWRRRRGNLDIDWSDVAEFSRPTITLRITRHQLEEGQR